MKKVRMLTSGETSEKMKKKQTNKQTNAQKTRTKCGAKAKTAYEKEELLMAVQIIQKKDVALREQEENYRKSRQM